MKKRDRLKDPLKVFDTSKQRKEREKSEIKKRFLYSDKRKPSKDYGDVNMIPSK